MAAARAGRLSVGDVTIFVAAIVGVQGALASLATAFARTHQALLLFGHYTAVVEAGPDLPVPREPRTLPALRHGIELKDVWFRYSDDHPWVLRGIDLFLPYGTSLALVGLNGAGKSTLIKLLCRFYDPTRGAVLWDGVDLRDTEPAELRSRLGAVFQDYMNYDMTATENIALGDIFARPDHARIATAAARAGIAPQLAALPYGYDTLLSRIFFAGTDRDDPETGVVLSGGQWQRLALARAFLRDRRDLMILDEPSSGLDAEAETEIHSSLKRHRSGRTSLLISHRLGAVREADAIAVLREGRIAELGSHDALMAAGESTPGCSRSRPPATATPPWPVTDGSHEARDSRHPARPRRTGARDRRPAGPRPRGRDRTGREHGPRLPRRRPGARPAHHPPHPRSGTRRGTARRPHPVAERTAARHRRSQDRGPAPVADQAGGGTPR